MLLISRAIQALSGWQWARLAFPTAELARGAGPEAGGDVCEGATWEIPHIFWPLSLGIEMETHVLVFYSTASSQSSLCIQKEDPSRELKELPGCFFLSMTN